MLKYESAKKDRRLNAYLNENFIKRGDIFLIQGEGIDYYKRETVPALVLQNNRGNKFAPTTIVALAIYQCELHKGITKFDFMNITTIDKRRIIRKIGNFPNSKNINLDQGIRHSVINRNFTDVIFV
ncbi:type II toxin-antitoxin system PemK/MazF family toxin [Rossellomorea oryzaecorticis]|uniref:Type II toxin-antitoxin system PemK/MazF family toxin n=1 Tax=Rossellomorea oryzaecorticis TaxID=1396505 RepID=A0ABU9K7U9_9BACI